MRSSSLSSVFSSSTSDWTFDNIKRSWWFFSSSDNNSVSESSNCFSSLFISWVGAELAREDWVGDNGFLTVSAALTCLAGATLFALSGIGAFGFEAAGLVTGASSLARCEFMMLIACCVELARVCSKEGTRKLLAGNKLWIF